MEKEKFIEKKRLENLVGGLNTEVDALIVEGLADKYVLQKLGFEGKIFLSAERTLEGLVEDVTRGADRVAVLTDFDEHGKEQNKLISRALEKEIDVIRSVREEFGAQLTSSGRRTVEDINPLFRDSEEKFVDAALDGLFFRS
ncbi:MAG: hypothetical protein ABEJ75_02420 [Candidatus Nanohaloarchaea archaeon]